MTTTGRTSVHDVALHELAPNPRNPRHDLGDLTDLIESITEHGILQPLLATRRPTGGLMLLAGHRRLAAAKAAGRTHVPILLVGPRLDDDQLILSLAENLHRTPLAPMDEAYACKALLDYGRTRRDVAVELARSGNWVADRLALLELPESLQREVNDGVIAIGKAAQLGHQIRKRRGGSITLGKRARNNFTTTHPLAPVATARCNTAEHPPLGRVGPACGDCWEQAIRDDERAQALITDGAA